MKLLIVACALVVVTCVGRSEGFTCSPCTETEQSRCPTVPAKDDCEEVLDYCGCCTKCAIKENHSCGDYSQRCETGLTCVKPSGPQRPPTGPNPDGFTTPPPPPTESYNDWWQRTRYMNIGTCTRS
ncbi:hypothetical protein SNE40_004046 [Patella caerulea]|uniref:IGFBP N-terminal domain-containing protein n=1 Tax=Patella caerulea TaxID=87958 RepID=A0AAN8Q9C1_PATCE